MAEINMGTLYDFNKQAMMNEKPLDPIAFNLKTNEIAEDMIIDLNDGDHYWMLLCHDRRDYTLFNAVNYEAEVDMITEELRPTLLNRGHILAIDKQPDGAWEIWVKDFDAEEVFAYYFFSYDRGVVEIYG